MSTKTIARVLPADVYDTLELVAEAYGGIGKTLMFEYEGDYPERNPVAPMCAHGAVVWATGFDACEGSRLRTVLDEAQIRPLDNDLVIDDEEVRIPFDEWCRRLHVVRGEG